MNGFTIGNISVLWWQVAVVVSAVIMWWVGARRYRLNAEKTKVQKHLRPVWILFVAAACASWIAFELFRVPSALYDDLVATCVDEAGKTTWVLPLAVGGITAGILVVCIVIAMIAASLKKAILKYKIAKHKAREI